MHMSVCVCVCVCVCVDVSCNTHTHTHTHTHMYVCMYACRRVFGDDSDELVVRGMDTRVRDRKGGVVVGGGVEREGEEKLLSPLGWRNAAPARKGGSGEGRRSER